MMGKSKLNLVVISVLGLFLLVSFQNCSQANKQKIQGVVPGSATGDSSLPKDIASGGCSTTGGNPLNCAGAETKAITLSLGPTFAQISEVSTCMSTIKLSYTEPEKNQTLPLNSIFAISSTGINLTTSTVPKGTLSRIELQMSASCTNSSSFSFRNQNNVPISSNEQITLVVETGLDIDDSTNVLEIGFDKFAKLLETIEKPELVKPTIESTKGWAWVPAKPWTIFSSQCPDGFIDELLDPNKSVLGSPNTIYGKKEIRVSDAYTPRFFCAPVMRPFVPYILDTSKTQIKRISFMVQSKGYVRRINFGASRIKMAYGATIWTTEAEVSTPLKTFSFGTYPAGNTSNTFGSVYLNGRSSETTWDPNQVKPGLYRIRISSHDPEMTPDDTYTITWIADWETDIIAYLNLLGITLPVIWQ